MEPASGRAHDILAPTRAAVVRYFALIAGATVLLLLITSPLRGESPGVMLCYVGLLGIFVFAHQRREAQPALAGASCALGPFVLVTVLVWIRGGIVHPAGVTAYVTLVAVTGLCWSSRGALTVAALSSAVLAWFVATGPTAAPYDKLQIWFELSVQLLIISMLVHFALQAISRSSLLALSHQTRFRDAIEGSPDAMIAVDSLGVIQMFNSQASAMSGVRSSQARGKTLSALNWLTPEALAKLEATVQLVDSQMPVASVELEHRAGLQLEASVALVTRHEGEPDRLISVRDVTERHAAQQAREALEGRIAQSKSIEALGRLAGGVAHDFNNMLTIISGTVELMQQRTDLDAEAREDLEQIEGASRRAAELTSQLLAFGRKQVLQSRVLCPNATLSHLQPMLKRLVREDIELLVHLDPELGNTSVDEARLEQVIVNLVSNASDAMQAGGKLTLETQNCALDSAYALAHPEVKAGDYVRIAVCDTGEGMAPETRSHIFEPFFTTKAHQGGTGLGLAMVHGIVAQSGGHIVVYSEPGEGTCFHLYFPRSLKPRSGAPRARESVRWNVPPTRVLLVEDQPLVRVATRRMLEALGHSVAEADDGLDAINRYSERIRNFDVLISDVIMPNVSGPELAAHMTQLHPRLEVLLISGYTAGSLVDDVALGKNTRFLAKPFDRRTLANELGRLLSEPR